MESGSISKKSIEESQIVPFINHLHRNNVNITVYSRGKNPYTTVTGKEEPTWRQVPDLNDCKLLSLGSNSGICVKQDNSVFTWGMNRNGNLGFGDRKDCYIPTLVKKVST